MDMVDTFNHLIPSDQLDESLVIGQNLECDASNEFASGLRLEDTLKNMLSDKDPMFGCATNQFNLLDNEDPAFPIAGTTDLDNGSTSVGLPGEVKATETAQEEQAGGQQKKRPCDLECEQSSIKKPNTPTKRMTRGPPGRKPANRLCKAFLIEKGVKGPHLKKELTLGGRINVNDLNVGSWLNPSVVLRRLTVTIGGFKIELLPGPSYTQTIDTSQPMCFDDIPYGGEIGYAILPDDGVSVQNPVPETVAEVDVNEKASADDPSLGLGPYVNPNDVQTANGMSIQNSSTQETKHDNDGVPVKQLTAGEEKDSVKQPESYDKPTTAVSDKTDCKHKTVAKAVLRSDQGMTLNKNKDSVPNKTSNSIKEHKVPQNMPPKAIQRGDVNKLKSQKEKQNISPLKRPTETLQSEHATKVQKLQAQGPNKVKPKVPSAPNSLGKKSPSVSNRAGDHQGPAKHTHPPSNGSKVETAQPTQSNPATPMKPPEEGGQEKSKVKKPEKILQRQKSKNARSISVEEPQLFVPDNAPVAKKETVEEQPATSEVVWDGNNCCGLCKRHHNNMFMVGCGRCDDWFHGDCVGLDLNKVREMEEEDQMYVCLKCCEEESTKMEPESPTVSKPEVQVKAVEVQDQKQQPKPRPGPSQIHESGGVRPPKDQDRRDFSDAREASSRTGSHHKQETKSKSSSASKKPVSAEAIRRNVRDSLKEILTQRLKESDLKISVERAHEVAKKTERELFHLYKDTDNKYKNKYRSLMFNLKDTKNNVLFKRVLKGEISPANLIRMSPEELASKELAAWRKRENRHTIEMIEKEQREVERRPITKITHKGEIEIESQEPVKTSEPAEVEPPPKVTETSAEPPKTPGKQAENPNVEKDTTNLHKSHLFDLHCKICTGRMAPPVEEAPTKVIKVATTVVRRQSTKTEEAQSTTPGANDDLHITVLGESLRNAKSGYEGRLDHAGGRNEVAFLSNLKSLWRGFIHMQAVAKLVTKAFPVSGVLDHLTEDLPDSIQVGGRISPQIVWDYLEKIRATGTKEVCLIRFSPETEEDEISYTLLYAYFSSRRRFGVVSNNLKQVKDMYLIPLGATEKVPHQLVPFDGPGLENNRANLLLGLIIRQRPKRDFLPVDVHEPATSIPEVKPVPIPAKETRASEEEEKRFLSSLTAPLKKDKEKALKTTEVINEAAEEAFEEPSAQENNIQESQKPLRFLPGVLLGWGGELPPLPDVGFKSTATPGDSKTTQPAQKTEASSGSSKSPTAAAPRERFVIKKKESKPLVPETELPCPADTPAAHNSAGKDGAAASSAAPLSLKDKPPDVSTEAFLASLLPAPRGIETDSAAPTNKGDAGLLSETEKGTTEGNSLSQPTSQPASDRTSSAKPALSGILKKSSAYSAASQDKTTAQQTDKASNPLLSSPKPAPVSSSLRSEPLVPFHQGYLQLSQAKHKPEDKHRAAPQSFPSKKEEPGTAQTGAEATEMSNPSEQAPQASTNTEASEPLQDSVVAPVEDNNTATLPSQQLHSQVPVSHNFPTTTTTTTPTPPSSLSSQDQNHSTQEADDNTSLDLNEPQEPESYFEPSSRIAAAAKRPEERYSDPWERPRATEDRDHHGRHGHHRDSHHGKKSRHHDREREKKHSRDRDRDRSRHHGHSEDRHGEKRKERHHSDDHGSRHKERHRHRRDSDYENGRRSSKDSYS